LTEVRQTKPLIRAERSNAERYEAHFSAFDVSAQSGFLFCIDVIGFYPVRIPACSRRLSECDTSGLGAQKVLHPDRDASPMHVSVILSAREEDGEIVVY
jgi:hypothetical protein